MKYWLLFAFLAHYTASICAQEVSHYTYQDVEVSNNTIYYLHEKAGIIYAATDNGITVISNGQNKFLYSTVAKSNSFSLLKEDASGALYVMNFRSQLFKIRADSLELYFDFNAYFPSRVVSYYFMGDFLYAHSHHHIRRFHLESKVEDQVFREKYQLQRSGTEGRLCEDSLLIGGYVVKADTLYYFLPQG